MKSAEYIDAIKQRLNLRSDYAVAKRLGVHPNRISNYRCGRSDFANDLMPKVAEMLDISPVVIFAEIGEARAIDEFERQCFRELAELARSSKKN